MLKVRNSTINKFFTNFEKYANSNLEKVCQDFVDEVSQQNSFDSIITCKMIDKQNLLISAAVKDNVININQLRIKAIIAYNISNCKKSRDFLDNFASNYQKTISKSDFGDALLWTIENRPMKYVYEFGDVSILAIELCTALLHELQHIYQKQHQDTNYYSFLNEYHQILTRKNQGKLPIIYKYPLEMDARLVSIEIILNYFKNNLNKKIINFAKQEIYLKNLHKKDLLKFYSNSIIRNIKNNNNLKNNLNCFLNQFVKRISKTINFLLQ